MNQQLVLDWFDQNKRNLPWRRTTPWGVMVSEFMLQQTPVNRVLPVWEEWIVRWPTPGALAGAKRSELITAWGRLGYPRRVLRLHETAQIIYQNYADEVPRDLEELRSLPGVGEYTAAAIAAFAFDKPTLVLDVNVRRLFARAIDGLEEPNPSLTLLERSARSELIPTDGAKWAAATMELGALICTSKNPHCTLCPLLNECSWQSQGSPKSKFARKGQEWAGTDRQCRGVIVQALRENRELSLKALQKMWHEDSQIERALKTLIADGLIMTIGKSYMLAD